MVTNDWERICKEEMSYLQKDIGSLSTMREEWPDDWEIQELTRALIHDEGQLIEMLKGEIEDGREAARKSA